MLIRSCSWAKHCEYCSCDAKILKQKGLESSHLFEVSSQGWTLPLCLMIKFLSWLIHPRKSVSRHKSVSRDISFPVIEIFVGLHGS